MKRMFILSFSLFSQKIFACPLCHTETGVQVNRGIFDENFLLNLSYSVLPFLVLAGLVSGVHFGFIRLKRIEEKKRHD